MAVNDLIEGLREIGDDQTQSVKDTVAVHFSILHNYIKLLGFRTGLNVTVLTRKTYSLEVIEVAILFCCTSH